MYALHTDLYQLTMAAGYFHRGLDRTVATCELFVRSLPPERRYLLAATGAPIDMYGVGTELVCSRDAPSLGQLERLGADLHRLEPVEQPYPVLPSARLEQLVGEVRKTHR